jgi:hypothetical protein
MVKRNLLNTISIENLYQMSHLFAFQHCVIDAKRNNNDYDEIKKKTVISFFKKTHSVVEELAFEDMFQYSK